jgi:hypothetical protein
VMSSCEHSHELQVPIKAGNLLYQWSDCHLFEQTPSQCLLVRTAVVIFRICGTGKVES